MLMPFNMFMRLMFVKLNHYVMLFISKKQLKLKSKNADMVVANDVTKEGAGFDVDTNIATLITKDGKVRDCELMTKAALADVILDELIAL